MKYNSKLKAFLVDLVFFIAGLLSWIFLVRDYATSLPLGIFYLILVINTYYSIKLFASITPPDDKINNFIDIILVLLYICVAVNLTTPLSFAFFTLLLFITSVIKYAFLLRTIDYLPLLKKKIIVDLLGCIFCALILGAMMLGYVTTAAWAFAGIFVVANILLFTVWPLYKID